MEPMMRWFVSHLTKSPGGGGQALPGPISKQTVGHAGPAWAFPLGKRKGPILLRLQAPRQLD